MLPRSVVISLGGLILLLLIIFHFWFSEIIFYWLYKTPVSPFGPVNAPAIALPDNEPVCKPGIWDHIYSPDRLYISQLCVSMTGNIEGFSPQHDGDTHIFIRLDPQYSQYTNIFNTIAFRGDLLGEIICSNVTSKQETRKLYCFGYNDPTPIPPPGTHVRITGSYVIDIHYGWREIHPVTAIDVLPN